MTSLGLLALLFSLSTLFGIINRRTLKLPPTIGILLIALLASLALIGLDALTPGHDLRALPRDLLQRADLPGNLLNGALSFLLFAGALQVDLKHLMAHKLSVLCLALIGTLLAVIIFGGAMWLVFPWVGIQVPFIWCIVLGAILAPTDPVSVVGMLRRLGLPDAIQAVFAGESLFNDGVGVVMFGVAMTLAGGDGHDVTAWNAVHAFGVEAIGGALLGFVLGWCALLCARLAEDAYLDLLLSLTLATGTFSLANALGMSGPIAVVVAGLWLGTRRAHESIDAHSRAELNVFWNLIDEVLNALLFLLIGLQVLIAVPSGSVLLALLIGIPLSLLARGLSVLVSTLPVHLRGEERGRALAVLTWGGLRGGISVSLALGLPDGLMKNVLMPICYGIVIFTIVVQGLTMERVARIFYPISKA